MQSTVVYNDSCVCRGGGRIALILEHGFRPDKSSWNFPIVMGITPHGRTWFCTKCDISGETSLRRSLFYISDVWLVSDHLLKIKFPFLNAVKMHLFLSSIINASMKILLD